jgi:hypothetical protein
MECLDGEVMPTAGPKLSFAAFQIMIGTDRGSLIQRISALVPSRLSRPEFNWKEHD